MSYDELIQTISEIIENENIKKEGLTLVYELPEILHRKMNEELFFKINPINTGLKYADVLDVELGGILVKFIKK